MTTAILIAVITLLCSFFFSGIEIAFLSASRLKIELRTVQGDRAGRILSNFKKKTSEVLITILIGNNLALVIFTIMMNQITDPVLGKYFALDPQEAYLLYTFVQAVVATLIVLVFAEYIPKALFRRNADTLIFPFAYLLQIFYVLFYVLMWAVNGVAKLLLLYLFRVPTEEKVVPLGRKDLDHYIQELITASETVPVPDLDTEMLTNAMAFKDTKARDFMIPRTEVIACSYDTPIDQVLDMFIETKLSKIIIYDDSLDDIKGFVNSRDLFKKPQTLAEIIQSAHVVPGSMPANMILAELTGHQRTLAVVVDEFGGTSGILTMEDLVEEVFGDIEDEHDFEESKDAKVDEDMIVQHLEDGGMLLGGRHEIDDLNEEFDLDLPEDEGYNTLGGLVLNLAEDIPEEGESFAVGKYVLTVVKASNTRLIWIRLTGHKD
ncbi:MAG: hemolysin family protein [Bacteroidia bacterium]|nr:hemolysin family protein [Bacteroidia bacterium]